MISQLLRQRRINLVCDKLIFKRNLKSKPQEPVKYTNTINLPKTKFPGRLNANQRKDVEENIRKVSRRISGQRFYFLVFVILELFEFFVQMATNKSSGKPGIRFTRWSTLCQWRSSYGTCREQGNLAIYFEFNPDSILFWIFQILKDIIIKDKIIHQKKVHYIPGWDCHGLPIELKALLNHKNFTPLQIRQKARKYALETVEKQKKSFESWGVTGSWNSAKDTYRTFDKNYIKNQNKLFYEMYSKGLIYRDLKPVFWSPSSGGKN